MRASRLQAMMIKEIIAGAPLIAALTLYSVGLATLFGFIARAVPRTTTGVAYTIWLLLVAILPSLTLGLTTVVTAINNEKSHRTAEMVLTTSLTPLEFLFSKWTVAFVAGVVGGFVSLALYTLLTLRSYIDLGEPAVWGYPLVVSFVFSSVGTASAVVSRVKDGIRRAGLYVLVFGVPLALASLTFVMPGLLPAAQPMCTPGVWWLLLVGYSAFCTFVAVKNLATRDFI